MERKRFEDLTPDEVRGFVERVVADAEPKHLSEWTTEETEELRKCIYSGHYDRENMLIELLRRTRAEERERCARVADGIVDEERSAEGMYTVGSDTWGASNGARAAAQTIAERIRGLQ